MFPATYWLPVIVSAPLVPTQISPATAPVGVVVAVGVTVGVAVGVGVLVVVAVGVAVAVRVGVGVGFVSGHPAQNVRASDTALITFGPRVTDEFAAETFTDPRTLPRRESRWMSSGGTSKRLASTSISPSARTNNRSARTAALRSRIGH